jgi:RHS repeat-associated protein
MGVTSYLTVDGEILSETRNGVEHDYVPNPLGSVVALLDSTQTKTDTWTYWPFGELVSRVGSSVTPFTFIGTYGYCSKAETGRIYVRVRFVQPSRTNWLTLDPLWPSEPAVAYVGRSPVKYVDYFGLENAGPIFWPVQYQPKWPPFEWPPKWFAPSPRPISPPRNPVHPRPSPGGYSGPPRMTAGPKGPHGTADCFAEGFGRDAYGRPVWTTTERQNHFSPQDCCACCRQYRPKCEQDSCCSSCWAVFVLGTQQTFNDVGGGFIERKPGEW